MAEEKNYTKIGKLRKDISKLEQWKDNSLKRNGEKERLEIIYHVRNKGFVTVIEELKQGVKANPAKIKRYKERCNQYMHNRMFQYSQKRLF